MPVGQGNITVNQLRPAAGASGAPFTAGSANNGLRVEPITGVIQLGGPLPNGAPLIEADTIISIQAAVPNQRFAIVYDADPGNQFIATENAGHVLWGLASSIVTDFASINVDPSSVVIASVSPAGDITAALSQSQGFRVTSGGNQFLLIDPANTYWAMGDLTNFLDPVMELTRNGVGNSIAGFFCPDPDGSADYAAFDCVVFTGGEPRNLSDVDGSIGRSMLEHQQRNLLYRAIIAGFNRRFMDLDITARTFSIGDLDTSANGSRVQVDDVNQRFNVIALNGIRITGDTTLIHTGTALADGAGGGAGTLNNAPAAGDPTKWIPIDDNGTTRFVPAW